MLSAVRILDLSISALHISVDDSISLHPVAECIISVNKLNKLSWRKLIPTWKWFISLQRLHCLHLAQSGCCYSWTVWKRVKGDIQIMFETQTDFYTSANDNDNSDIQIQKYRAKTHSNRLRPIGNLNKNISEILYYITDTIGYLVDLVWSFAPQFLGIMFWKVGWQYLSIYS